jgi:hypothetical protein
MSRHSFLIAVTLAASVLVPTITFAKNANQNTSPIDVVYLFTQDTVGTYTIQTYDVDPGYGDATLYGTLSVYTPPKSYYAFVPGAGDHYIYGFCTCGTEGTVLQVYATDSNGAPQNPPIQTVRFGAAISPFLIDPDGTLAYATQPLESASGEHKVEILAFAIDPETGIVTVPPVMGAVITAPLACSPENPFGPPSFSLVGFNLSGAQMIDAWSCAGHGDSESYFYTQTVNQKTGALGLPVATVGEGSSEDEYDRVTFTPTAILSFQNEGYENSANELYVYWTNATLDFSCTYTMLDACSYSSGIAADRTGEFVFFYTYTGGTEVTRLNVNQKTIEPVGTPLANMIDAFSLDDRLIYGFRTLSSNGQYVIPVYVFDAGTGLVTDNGTVITMPNEYSSLIPALRY